MRRLLLFNPENDIALAHDDANFTPSRAVADFHQAGAALPLWYGDATGDMVYAPHIDRKWADKMCRMFALPASIFTPSCETFVEPAPWGFSLHALKQYEKAGVEIDMDVWKPRINHIRMLSHRRTAAELLDRLRVHLPYPLPPTPMEATSVAEVVKYATATPHFYMKAPWSSSGRGVVCSSSVPRAQLLRQAEGIIRRQGSVMLEKALNKTRDFASLYKADKDGVHHIGYSVFFNTHGSTAYSGNVVASDKDLLDLLSHDIDPALISATAEAVAMELTGIGIHTAYHGCLGVDMMTYIPQDGERPLIAPAVEINLRMTMGIVAHILYRHLLPDGQRGIFSVAYAPDMEYTSHFESDGRQLRSGTLHLIPPHPGFRITLNTGDHQAFNSR